MFPGGVNVLAQRMTISSRRGGALSIHLVANLRMLSRELRSTCSAVISSLCVSALRSRINSARNVSVMGWWVSSTSCAPRNASSFAAAAPIPEVAPLILLDVPPLASAHILREPNRDHDDLGVELSLRPIPCSAEPCLQAHQEQKPRQQFQQRVCVWYTL